MWGFARRAERSAPVTDPIAMIDDERPYWPAPLWKTVTDMVEMKIGKLSPKVPNRKSMSRMARRSRRFRT